MRRVPVQKPLTLHQRERNAALLTKKRSEEHCPYAPRIPIKG